MQIIHGENTVQSRNYLNQILDKKREEGCQVIRLEAKQLTLPLLEEQLAGQSLFGEEKVLVIEELHSLPKSKRKDELIELLAKHATSLEMILWEKRSLTLTMLKKFPQAKSQEFKVTSALFKWLDSLTGEKKLAHQQVMLKGLAAALESDGEVMCLVMLARQIRLLLQVKENNMAGLAPFMIAKLKKQAQSFTEPQLLHLHRRILAIDLAQKTSSSRLNTAQQLELLLLEM